MAAPNDPQQQQQPQQQSQKQQQQQQHRAHRPWTFGRVLRNVAGVVLVLLGVAGFVLPILQGWLFLVLGLALIDMPIKHRVHVRLLRWGWYRKVAAYHERFAAKWRARRQRKREERERRKALAGRSVVPPP